MLFSKTYRGEVVSWNSFTLILKILDGKYITLNFLSFDVPPFSSMCKVGDDVSICVNRDTFVKVKWFYNHTVEDKVVLKPIEEFRGRYDFLSNFYEGKWIEVDNGMYPTVEHAYQALKTTNYDLRKQFQSRVLTPGDAKRVGRELKLREDWETIKLAVMLVLLRRKFEDPLLANLLLATGDTELIEGNYWGDKYWGKYHGEGENHLGRLLMQVRNELRKPS